MTTNTVKVLKETFRVWQNQVKISCPVNDFSMKGNLQKWAFQNNQFKIAKLGKQQWKYMCENQSLCSFENFESADL